MRSIVLAGVLALCVVDAGYQAQAVEPPRPCGDANSPCAVALGDYHAAMPKTPLAAGEKRPAVLFFHGAGGLGRSVLEEGSFLRPSSKRAMSCSAQTA